MPADFPETPLWQELMAPFPRGPMAEFLATMLDEVSIHLDDVSQPHWTAADVAAWLRHEATRARNAE